MVLLTWADWMCVRWLVWLLRLDPFPRQRGSRMGSVVLRDIWKELLRCTFLSCPRMDQWGTFYGETVELLWRELVEGKDD